MRLQNLAKDPISCWIKKIKKFYRKLYTFRYTSKMDFYNARKSKWSKLKPETSNFLKGFLDLTNIHVFTCIFMI